MSALARIVNPRLDADLVSAGMVRDLAVSGDGAVTFTFLLSADDPATLVRQARAAVEAVAGVAKERVKITVKNPAASAGATTPPPGTAPASPPPPQMPPPPTPV